MWVLNEGLPIVVRVYLPGCSIGSERRSPQSPSRCGSHGKHHSGGSRGDSACILSSIGDGETLVNRIGAIFCRSSGFRGSKRAISNRLVSDPSAHLCGWWLSYPAISCILCRSRSLCLCGRRELRDNPASLGVDARAYVPHGRSMV